MEVESKEQIFKRRKEIEQELLNFLKETESDFGLDDIKEIIYNEEGQDDLMDVVMMFDNGQGAAEMENIMDTIRLSKSRFLHIAE